MRTLIYFILFFFLSLQVKGQFSENHNIYTQSGFSLGTHLGIHGSIDYIYKNTYSLSVGARLYGQKSKQRPSDFKGGFASAISLGLADGNDLYTDVYVLVGRVLPINIPERRLNLRAGLSFTDVTKAINFQPIEKSILGGNYSFDNHRFSTVSLVLNPTLEYTFSQVLGISVYGLCIVNKETVNVAVGCGMIYGFLRGPRRRAQRNIRGF